MIDVGDDVGDADDVALQRQRARFRPAPQQLAFLALGMFQDSVADFDGQIEIFEHFDHAHRLAIVIEAAFHQLVECSLACVTECGVAEVVAETDGFGEDFIEAQ